MNSCIYNYLQQWPLLQGQSEDLLPHEALPIFLVSFSHHFAMSLLCPLNPITVPIDVYLNIVLKSCMAISLVDLNIRLNS